MADAASPPRAPDPPGSRAVCGSIRLLAAGLIVLALLVGVFVLLLESSFDEPAASSPLARAELLAPRTGIADLPDVAEPAVPSLAEADVESLADAPTGDLELRRRELVLDMWDRPLPGAHERAPCTLIVIDDHDRPVAGARVQVWGEEGEPVTTGGGEAPIHIVSRSPPIGPIPYVTDQQGRCVVQPPLWTPQVLVEKEGVGCSGWIDLDLRSKTHQTRALLVPLQRPALIRGLVANVDGSAIPNARVELSSPSAPGAPARVPDALVADAEGRFELQVDGVGRYSFSIDDGSGKPLWRRIRPLPGAVHDIVLRLPAQWVLRGQLVRPKGPPDVYVANCLVRFWPERPADAGPADLWEGALDYSDKTDGDGRFEIVIDKPVKGLVIACIEAWGLADPPWVQVDADHPQVDVVLDLCEPAWIAGRCVDESGQPLRNTKVSCSTAETLAPPGGLTRVRNSHLFGSSSTTTGDDGSFQLGPVHSRSVYDVRAYSGEGDDRRIISRQAVLPGTSDLVLALGSEFETCASVILLVQSGANGGGPVTRFHVRAWRRLSDGAFSQQAREFMNDERGLGTLDRLVPGTELCLVVGSENHGSVVLSKVVATEEGTELKVVLPAAASAELLVTDDGVPASWAIVTPERSSEGCTSRPDWAASRRTDDAGRLMLTGLDPGHYRFIVTHGEHSTRRAVDLAPGSITPLTLELR